MNANNIIQIVIYFGVLLLLAWPLGGYIASVYEGRPIGIDRIFKPVEDVFYKICRIRSDEEMDWKQYARAVLAFSALGMLMLYILQRFQGSLPLNPQKLQGISPDLAFNTAMSFMTNTNWQAYSGESTMGYLVQMAGLTVQNFVSAGTGMAVLVALIRGFTRQSAQTIGNFWVDLVRSVLYILLPLSIIYSLLLVSQGVVQSFSDYKTVTLTEAITYDSPKIDLAGNPLKDMAGNIVMEKVEIKEQVIPLGPAASQIAIKQLGTNGGGFFGVNSSHPFENPTSVSNFLEALAILLLPVSLCMAFGMMIGDRRQGRALLTVMSVVFLLFVCIGMLSEQQGNPNFTAMGVDQKAGEMQPGGNMEGKEARFGIANSVIWAMATTAASNGSVNSMHDSFSPMGGMAAMMLIQLGEIIFGGVGSGLYGMLVFAMLTVFVAGLMVGRTPEYLGKKIEAFEMKMTALVILIVNGLVMVGTAIAVMVPTGAAAIANPGPHGFSEILYAISSAANNNGSAFAGLSVNQPFYNTLLGIVMFIGRFGVIIPVLAMAGSLARKKNIPVSLGTLPTHTPLFIIFLLGVIMIVGALTFMPSLALGPIAEQLIAAGK